MGLEKMGIINIDHLHEKAVDSLNEYRIDMDEFKDDVYRKEDVERDQEYTKKCKQNHEEDNTVQEKEAKKLATIFEAIMQEHAELSNWLGENVCTVSTSEYDDIVNGIDMIAEFKKRGRYAYHLGLAVDTTYCSDLNKKFDKIKDDIEKGKLALIKYFKSEDSGFMGRLAQVPKVVIGADVKTINELMELWHTGRKKELAEHPIQFQILEQMLDQLKVFQEYSLRTGHEDLADKYESAEKIISEIYNKRKEKIKDNGVRDEMSTHVTEYLKIFSE